MKDLDALLDQALDDNRLDDASRLLLTRRAFADPPDGGPSIEFETIRDALPIRPRRRWPIVPAILVPLAAAAALVFVAQPESTQRAKGAETCDEPVLRLARWHDQSAERLDSRIIGVDTRLVARADVSTPCWISMFAVRMIDGAVDEVRVIHESPRMVSGRLDLFEPGGHGAFALDGVGDHVLVLTASREPLDLNAERLAALLEGAPSDTVAFDVMALEVR